MARSPSSRHLVHGSRPSSSSLRNVVTAPADPGDLPNGSPNGNANGSRHHSLAHELAVALMPEPSVASKLLAEEFGIEYDQGAEGIDSLPGDDQLHDHQDDPRIDVNVVVNENLPDDASNFQDIPSALAADDADHLQRDFETVDDSLYSSSSSTFEGTKVHAKIPEQDPLQVLSQNLESMDKFLHHLRRIDADPGGSSSSHATSGSAASTSAIAASSQQISLEKIASNFIRHINQSTRDREGQVRELSVCEREFRKLAVEVGGEDVLGSLDEITGIEELSDGLSTGPQQQQDKAVGIARKPTLDAVIEEEPSSPSSTRRRHRHQRNLSTDWELDPDRNHLGDEEDDDYPEDGEGEDTFSVAASPVKDAFPRAQPPPPLTGPITPAKTVPQLAHLRTSTSSLASQLTTLSEHAQVNGAATAESGRKIRALKNKLGGWRTEWESAERSRQRIEKWEAGIIMVEVESLTHPQPPVRTSSSSSLSSAKGLDGRIIVQEHLRASELALADAALKTHAIMAIITR